MVICLRNILREAPSSQKVMKQRSVQFIMLKCQNVVQKRAKRVDRFTRNPFRETNLTEELTEKEIRKEG